MITGRFTTTAPLHVGCGLPTTHPDIIDDSGEKPEPSDVQAVVADYRHKPCVPGTAVKGVLRAWAERFFPNHRAIDRVFGSPNADAADAESGRADFLTAFVDPPSATDLDRFARHLPYWRADRLTAVASNVCLD
ncbi:MAG TPA: RAMP superfamily CRISPR-associated protein, partial [Urbifossiella sp.]|nr:RAMP superfamily CRISPR-associated protein [Urbifossiella sp.]